MNHRARRSIMLVAAFTLAACGDDSRPEESRAELEAELAKLSSFHERDFRAGDTNNDLRLQDTELRAMLEEDFKKSDVDQDGEITGADLRQYAGDDVDVEASLDSLDIDANGRVSIEEYAKQVERDFMRHMDTNDDGHVDPSEASGFYVRQTEGPETK